MLRFLLCAVLIVRLVDLRNAARMAFALEFRG
jgi:hypothetical protein